MDFLIPGNEYLAKTPDFKLIGREVELQTLSAILVRKSSNSVLLVGPAGVGATAICKGLQAMKDDVDAPFDIVSKRFFWLDTDSLFSSGDSDLIGKAFQQAINRLKSTPDSVLVIEDTGDFLESCRNCGTTHFINALTSAVREKKVQVIFEVSDQDLNKVMNWHSDLRESYTLMDVAEPTGESLYAIVEGAANDLVRHHAISIDPEAIQTAIELTTKYRVDAGLSPAQPKRSIGLLDRAFASYRLKAHKNPPHLVRLRDRLSKASDSDRAAIEAELATETAHWEEQQGKLKTYHRLQREGENNLVRFEDELERSRAKDKEGRTGPDGQPAQRNGFNALVSGSAYDLKETEEIKGKIAQMNAAIAENARKFSELTAEINASLHLDRVAVMSEFSSISGIAVNKLNEDELLVLKRLEDDLKANVFRQDHVLTQVADAIKVARVGRRNKNRPQAAFMFMGPSGVGKTEVAKQIAKALLGDAKALTRFDMSEYMNAHDAAKLIGAPPGYEGFEAGGILTNYMRQNRNRVILFDEIEKAHKDVFNLFLQILDDGRLTDNVGRVAEFSDAIIIMTTNIGQPFFLDSSLPFQEAMVLANEELEQTYRPEFLNRFNGRQNLVGFNRLELPSIEKIIRREVNDLDQAYRSHDVAINLSDEQIVAFCADRYDPVTGARGLPGYIVTALESKIVNHLLDGEREGVFDVRYDTDQRNFEVVFQPNNAMAAEASRVQEVV